MCSLFWAHRPQLHGLWISAHSLRPPCPPHPLPPTPPPPPPQYNKAELWAALYRMLPKAYCPRELVARGSVNSMLGEVVGEDLPLRFRWAAGGNTSLMVEGAYVSVGLWLGLWG